MTEEDNMFLSKVTTDEEGNTVMLFTKELLQKLNLQDGEILLWAVGDNTITIQRPKYIDTK